MARSWQQASLPRSVSTPVLPARWRPALPFVPVAVLFVLAVVLVVPATRQVGHWLLDENRPVELLTLALLIVGGVAGLRLAGRLRRRGQPGWVWGFYALFATGLLVVAGEEVAWGQWFFGFETPAAIGAVNTQDELTLHNYEGFNDHLELFPLAFGVAGLVSLALGATRWARLASPRPLLSWYATIAALGAVDLVQDFHVIQADFDHLVNGLAEGVEMLVAGAGLLYVVLGAERFDTWSRDHPAPLSASTSGHGTSGPRRVREHRAVPFV